MIRSNELRSVAVSCFAAFFGAVIASAADAPPPGMPFPTPLDAYASSEGRGLFSVFAERVRQDWFNLVATLIFVGALVHTFCTGLFRKWAHAAEARHKQRMSAARAKAEAAGRTFKEKVSFRAVALELYEEAARLRDEIQKLEGS